MNLLKKSDSEGPEASSDPPALSLVLGEANVEHQCPNLLINVLPEVLATRSGLATSEYFDLRPLLWSPLGNPVSRVRF